MKHNEALKESGQMQQSKFSRRNCFVSLASVFLVGLTAIRVYNSQQNFSQLLLYASNNDAPVQTAITNGSKTTTTTTTTTTTIVSLANSERTFQTDNNTLIEAWRKKRVGKDIYDSWFDSNTEKLADNADSEGPILDFIIAGFPKCGTTAMMKFLATVTTMPENVDVCTPLSNTVYYSYINWSIEHGNGAHNFTDDKPLRGTKCPRYIEGEDLDFIGKKLPKSKLIVGIRHPVLWFQSFTNMLWHNAGKHGNNKLDEYVLKQERRIGRNQKHKCKMHACVPRSRFHLSLARLGKTPLDQDEIDLLQSESRQSALRLNDTSAKPREYPFANNREKAGVPNEVFIFESSQGKEEYFYQDLAMFLEFDRARLPALDNTIYRSGNGLNSLQRSKMASADKGNSVDICLPQFDVIRKELLPISYTLGQWLKKYLIPASHQRNDLTIPNVTAFESIVETFARDPCQNRLVRNDDDGEYYLAEKGNGTSE